MSAGNGTNPQELDSWWVGYLAATIAHALSTEPLEGARFVLDGALSTFKASPACSTELRRQLQRKGGRR